MTSEQDAVTKQASLGLRPGEVILDFDGVPVLASTAGEEAGDRGRTVLKYIDVVMPYLQHNDVVEKWSNPEKMKENTVRVFQEGRHCRTFEQVLISSYGLSTRSDNNCVFESLCLDTREKPVPEETPAVTAGKLTIEYADTGSTGKTAFARRLPGLSQSNLLAAAGFSLGLYGLSSMSGLRIPRPRPLPPKGPQNCECYAILTLLVRGWKLGNMTMSDGTQRHGLYNADAKQYHDLDLEAFDEIVALGWVELLDKQDTWEITEKGRYWENRY